MDSENPMYVGASDHVEEGKWRWISGEPLANEDRLPETFHAWHPLEPNGSGSGEGREHYLIVAKMDGTIQMVSQESPWLHSRNTLMLTNFRKWKCRQ